MNSSQSPWLDFAIRVAFALAVICAFPAAPANAQSSYCTVEGRKGSMRATFLTLNESRVLLLMGVFSGSGSADSKYGTHSDVQSAIRRTNSYDEIWFCSGGGVVQEGYKVGRTLSSVRAKVRVPNGFLCVSSCTIAFLGGYLRTIDRQSEFGIHSSSGVSNLSADRPFVIECSEIPAAVCQSVVPVLQKYEEFHCSDVKEFEKPGRCLSIIVGTPSRPRQIAVKLEWLMKAELQRSVLEAFVNNWGQSQWKLYFEMIQYYQTMLNDGNTRMVESGYYRRLLNSHAWPAVFGTSGAFRNAGVDVEELSSTGTEQGRLIKLQDLLTEIEIEQQEIVIDYLRQHQTELGRGGKEALNIMQAMITCRIQSVCYPDRNTLARLGYHNFDMD